MAVSANEDAGESIAAWSAAETGREYGPFVVVEVANLKKPQ